MRKAVLAICRLARKLWVWGDARKSRNFMPLSTAAAEMLIKHADAWIGIFNADCRGGLSDHEKQVMACRMFIGEIPIFGERDGVVEVIPVETFASTRIENDECAYLADHSPTWTALCVQYRDLQMLKRRVTNE